LSLDRILGGAIKGFDPIDIVDFALCNADPNGDVASEIQERMELDGGFLSAEFGPWENRKTKIGSAVIHHLNEPWKEAPLLEFAQTS